MKGGGGGGGGGGQSSGQNLRTAEAECALDEKNAALRKLERASGIWAVRVMGGGPFPGLAAGASLTLGTTGGLVVKRTPRIGVGTERRILGKFQAQAAAATGKFS